MSALASVHDRGRAEHASRDRDRRASEAAGEREGGSCTETKPEPCRTCAVPTAVEPPICSPCVDEVEAIVAAQPEGVHPRERQHYRSGA